MTGNSHISVDGFDGIVFADIDGLDVSVFPNEYINFNPSEPLHNATLDFANIYDADSGEWAIPVATSSCYQRGRRIANLMNGIAKAAAEYASDEPEHLRSWSSLLSSNERSETRPGIVLIEDDSEEVKLWPKVLAIADFYDEGELQQTLKRLIVSAMSVFVAQPDRVYLVGIIFNGSNATLIVFNRTGVFLSKQFDINNEPEKLLRVVGGLAFGDRECLGFDSSMHVTSVDGSQEYFVNVQGRTYEVQEVLHIEKTLCGRGTVCLSVERNGEKYVVKNTWRGERERRDKISFLQKLQGIEGVPTLVAFEYIKRRGTEQNPECPNIDTLASRVCKKHRMKYRDQVRIVSGPCGTDFRSFTSLREFLFGLMCIVDAIESIYRKGYVHRDISKNNIIFGTKKNRYGERYAYLIDFDLAQARGRGGEAVGSFPFMSIEVLTGFKHVKHDWHHDLESLFYLFIYICCTCSGPNVCLRKDFDIRKSPLGAWYEGERIGTDKEWLMASFAKKSSMRDTAFEDIIDNFDEYFRPLSRCARRLYSIFFPNGLYYSNPDPSVYFPEFREALQEAHDTVGRKRAAEWRFDDNDRVSRVLRPKLNVL